MGAGEIFLEPQDIADLGPAPAVDGLIIIADAADVLVTIGEQAQPEVLGDVSVLVFVHEDVTEPAAVLVENILILLEDRDHVEQQVSEIGGVQLDQAGLVLGVKFNAFAVIGAAFGDGDIFRRPGAVFPAVDDAGEHPGGPALVVDIGSRDELLEQADLIVGVEDREVRFQTDEFSMTAQQLDADRVEGAEPGHAFDILIERAADAEFHLARGFVCEGHGEDFVGPGGARHQQMRDAGGERFGLAGARPCEHQDGAFHLLDGFAVGGV